MKGTTPSLHSEKNSAVTSFFWFFTSLMLVFAFFCYYQPVSRSYSIFSRTWGFDHLTFYSPVLQGLFFGIALLFIVPATNRLVEGGLSRLMTQAAGWHRLKVWLFVLVSLISVALFYAFKTKYFFLGDFNLRLEQVMRKDFLANEYLTMRLLYYLATFGGRYGFTPYQVFEWYSCAAGGVFVFFSCLLADSIGKTPLQKLFYLLAHLSSALLLVFCGYIEIYATPVVLLTLYLYAGMRYLNRGRGFYLLVIILGVAVASHVLCVTVLPSLAVLWYFNNRPDFIASVSNTKIALTLGTLIVLALIVILRVGNAFVLPLSPPPKVPGYLTFFTLRHFWEFFNGQLLACGLSFIVVFIALMRIIREEIRLDGHAYFLLSVSGCTLFIVLLANLHRGSCDWDIMAFTAISLNLLTAVLLVAAYGQRLSHYLLVALIGINALHAFLWIHINHTDRSIHKVERMLTKDPASYYAAKLPPMIALTMLYKGNNLWPETERAALMACDNYNTLAGCLTYGAVLVEENKKVEACKFFEGLLDRTPYVPEAYNFLLEYYEANGQTEKVQKYLNYMFDAFLMQPDYFLSKAAPKVYRDLFSYLYNLELPKKDLKRLEKISFNIQKLNTLVSAPKK